MRGGGLKPEKTSGGGGGGYGRANPFSTNKVIVNE